jgi:3',5'-nucleoside bisphosphate phosphatase
VAKGDFHLHSTASDGIHSPAWVMETAARNGVRVLSLSDHDTTDGLDEAAEAAARLGLTLVPGIELSTDMGKVDVHLLGYGFDPGSTRLQEYLTWLRDSRHGRAYRIVEVLAGLGAPVAVERVFAIAGEASVGRPHIARALVEAGYASSVQDAFDRYLANGGPADVPRAKMTPEQAIAEVHAAGGVVFVAHPLFMGDAAHELVAQLAGWGLDGIETYYKHYRADEVASHRALGKRLGLACSGGSDFHGLGNPDDRAIGDIPFEDADVDAFVRFIHDSCVKTNLAEAARA